MAMLLIIALVMITVFIISGNDGRELKNPISILNNTNSEVVIEINEAVSAAELEQIKQRFAEEMPGKTIIVQEDFNFSAEKIKALNEQAGDGEVPELLDGKTDPFHGSYDQ